jgi:hypothetical protein
MLSNLLATQDTLARLEAEAALADPAVQEGLLARLALREAAGWLAHHGSWVHPLDLALRESGITGSYAAAALGRRLPSVLPATDTQEPPPEDRDVAHALAHAARWRRLALGTWSPPDPPPPETPALPAIARMIAGAGEGGRADRLSATALLHAAWLWRAAGNRTVPIPFWSAPVSQLHRLALSPSEPAALAALAEAAIAARRLLARLRTLPPVPGRGHLPAARAEAIRRPVLTGRMLADRLRISPRAALALIARLQSAGLLREATGRRAWRAFVIQESLR